MGGQKAKNAFYQLKRLIKRGIILPYKWIWAPIPAKKAKTIFASELVIWLLYNTARITALNTHVI